MDIKTAIQNLAKSSDEIYCKICKIDAVDDSARTIDCTPIDGSAQILGVNLQANQDATTGIVCLPKKDSHAVVAFIDKAHAVALLFEEIESIRIDCGDTSIEIDNEKNITLNEGSHTAVFGDTLKQELDKMSARIDGIINVMKALPPVIAATASAMGADGGEALTTTMTPLDTLLKENFSQIENDKIKY